MKIAVPFSNGEVFQHFGHTENFKLYEIENGEIVPGASIFGAIVTDANVTVTVNGAVTQINIPNGGKVFYCFAVKEGGEFNVVIDPAN